MDNRDEHTFRFLSYNLPWLEKPPSLRRLSTPEDTRVLATMPIIDTSMLGSSFTSEEGPL